MNDAQPPNMALIQQVQQGRMAHDTQARPSQISGVYWIEAKAAQGSAPTSHAGYWLIETTVQEVDALWEKIKQATEAGLLGYKSKVLTAPANYQTHPDARVMHIQTYDDADKEDIERVRAALQALEITQTLTYHSKKEG